MIHAQMSKLVSLIDPVSFGTSATTSATVSVVGYNYAEVYCVLATTTNTDTSITLTEGDTTSSFATASDLTMATASTSTSAATVYGWFLDLRKRKKNLKIAYQPATGARVGTVLVRLSRAEQPPTTAAGRGVTNMVIA